MATRKNTAPKTRISRSYDLTEILGRLSEARDILECAYAVLEDGDPGKEAACFTVGLQMLGSAYSELDEAFTAMAQSDG